MHADTTHSRAPRRARTALAALGAAALAALSLALGAAAPAQAHDQLVEVTSDLEPDGEHIVLTLQFNNEIMDVGTEIVATGPDGADLLAGDPEVSGRDVAQRIAMPGFDETVTVLWRVASSDGHPISDAFTVTAIQQGDDVGWVFGEVSDGSEEGSGDGDQAEDGAGHDHAAEHEHQPEYGSDPVNIDAILVIAVALVAAGAVAAVVLVGRRRRRAAGTAESDAETGEASSEADR